MLLIFLYGIVLVLLSVFDCIPHRSLCTIHEFFILLLILIFLFENPQHLLLFDDVFHHSLTRLIDVEKIDGVDLELLL
jgi:hypothetical protein